MWFCYYALTPLPPVDTGGVAYGGEDDFAVSDDDLTGWKFDTPPYRTALLYVTSGVIVVTVVMSLYSGLSVGPFMMIVPVFLLVL